MLKWDQSFIISWALFALLITQPYALFSQLNEKKASDIIVVDQVAIFRDASRKITISDILQQQFEPTISEFFNIGFTNDACWLRFQLINTSFQEQHCVLNVGKLLVDSVQLFYKDSSVWQTNLIGVNVPNEQKRLNGKSSYFSIRLAGLDTGTFYMRTASTYGIQHSLNVLSQAEVRSLDNKESLLQGFYLGAMLIITFYNLFLGVSIRDNLYLHYALANLAALILALSIRGFFSYHLPLTDISWTPHLITLATTLYIVISSNFNIRFLQLRQYSLHAYYLIMSVAGLSMAIAIILSLMRMNGLLIHNGWLAYTNILFTVVAIYAGVVAYFKGSHYAKYYLMGWTLVLLSVMLYTMMISGLLERNGFTNNIYLIGSVSEVLLLSFALADRYNRVQQERNELQESLKFKQGDLAKVISDNRMRIQFKTKLLQDIEELRKEDASQLPVKVNSLANDLRFQIEKEKKFDYYEANIDDVNTEFESKIMEAVPSLTEQELEICNLIKLKLSNKDIAQFRNTSDGAIKVARHRIRKKFSEQNLDMDTFIHNLGQE